MSDPMQHLPPIVLTWHGDGPMTAQRLRGGMAVYLSSRPVYTVEKHSAPPNVWSAHYETDGELVRIAEAPDLESLLENVALYEYENHRRYP